MVGATKKGIVEAIFLFFTFSQAYLLGFFRIFAASACHHNRLIMWKLALQVNLICRELKTDYEPTECLWTAKKLYYPSRFY